MSQKSKNANQSGTERLNLMDRSKATSALKIKVRGQLYFIPLNDIIYLEKNLRKIIVHTRKGDISFYGKFCDIMPFLDGRFVCCHKSFVLNMAEICLLSRDEILMSNGGCIKFGKHCYDRLVHHYKKWESETL